MVKRKCKNFKQLNMNKIVILIVSFFLLTSCGNDLNKKDLAINKSDLNNEKVNNHLNIIITPDLSNRISFHTQNKPVNDTVLIKELLDIYYPDIYKSNNRITGQKDEISFLFTNPTIISKHNINMEDLNINFSDFNDGQRIQYLVSFTKDIPLYELDKKRMNKEVRRIYNNFLINPGGADILNFFNTQMNASKIKKNSNPIKIDQTIVYNNQRNILVLFTDGYIEAGMYGENNCQDKQCVFLDETKVNEFRESYKASGKKNMKIFFEENNYGINPIENDQLKNLEVIVVEMYDRSLASSGSQRKIPNDLDILKLFWSDWLEKSGIKKYKLYGTVSSKDEFKKNIISFIEDN